MRALFPALAGLAIAAPALATGFLENPQPRSYQSGIGVISGWHCTATRVQVQIDDFPPLDAGTRTERNDTASVCGRADTGFSLLFAYSLLDPAKRHRIVAFADGVEFARADDFHVASLGVDYLTGVSATAKVLNFPRPGVMASLVWTEDVQNFTLRSTSEAPTLSGVYYGAHHVDTYAIPAPPTRSTHLTQFTVTVDAGRLTLVALRDDGWTCTLSAPGRMDPDGFFRTIQDETVVSTCTQFRGDFSVAVDGERLTGRGYNISSGQFVVGAK